MQQRNEEHLHEPGDNHQQDKQRSKTQKKTHVGQQVETEMEVKRNVLIETVIVMEMGVVEGEAPSSRKGSHGRRASARTPPARPTQQERPVVCVPLSGWASFLSSLRARGTGNCTTFYSTVCLDVSVGILSVQSLSRLVKLGLLTGRGRRQREGWLRDPGQKRVRRLGARSFW